MSRTLILSATMEPVRVASWEDAITLVVKGHAEVLEEYEQPVAILSEKLIEYYKEFIHAMRKSVADAVDNVFTVHMPSVIRLLKAFKRNHKKIKFSRLNVFARDGFKCQYCGKKSTQSSAFNELTYDHVLPRYLGGRTEWTNIATACRTCNSFKANRTPEMAGMRLLKRPVVPKHIPIIFALRFNDNMPPEWRNYLWDEG